MEQQIHNLEMDAYCAVLRAFKAQSEVLTWDKEGLMTELRKELRVSDDEHREVLSKVNNDDIIGRIREWRKGGGHQAMSTSHPINDVPSPTHVSRKKQRTSQSLSTRAAPQSGGTLGPRGRKFRQFPYNNHDAHGTIQPGSGEELVGKKVLTRWPDDNHFYEAVVSRYNASDGRHELVYGIHTPQESFEWVNLMEIPPEDIRWVNEDSISSRRVGPGEKRSINHVSSTPTVGRKQYRSEIQNGARNSTDDIEILHTATLIKEVEKVVAAMNPDRLELERAKKMLEEHELALVDAISRLTYISDGDSGNCLLYNI